MILKPVLLATVLYTSQHTDKMAFQPGQTDGNQKWHSQGIMVLLTEEDSRNACI